MVPLLLRGEEIWCQGFSEPGTGSNLASLACRATRTDEGWRVNGQKVWTSLAQYAQRCVLLTRTGTTESAHRGITALFVDMDRPGITVRPIETMHGSPGVLRGLLRRRRRAARPRPGRGRPRLVHRHGPPALRAQHRAVAPGRLPAAAAGAAGGRRPPGSLDPVAVGEAHRAPVVAFRARSRATQRRLAAGETLGAETSIDKVLVATAEQAVFDLVAEGLGAEVVLGDDPVSQRGGPSSSTPAPPRSTAAAPRSSATSSPGGCSTSEPTADGGAERELFESGVRRATETTDGAALDGALDDLGWRDALGGRPAHRRLAALRVPGSDHDTSAALDRLLGDRPRASTRRRPGRSRPAAAPPLRPPARLDGDWCVVEGLATAALASADIDIAVVGSPGRRRAATVA